MLGADLVEVINPLLAISAALPGFISHNPWLGLLGFAGLLYLLVAVPLKAMRQGGALGAKMD